MLNDSNLERVSEKVKQYSAVTNLDELRAQYKPDFDAREHGRSSGISSLAIETLARDDHSEMERPADRESYSVIQNSEIDYSQSERLVKKVLSRNK